MKRFLTRLQRFRNNILDDEWERCNIIEVDDYLIPKLGCLRQLLVDPPIEERITFIRELNLKEINEYNYLILIVNNLIKKYK